MALFLCRCAALVLAILLAAAPLPASAASSLPVARVVSPGGIVAWLVEDHSNPIIGLGVGFAGGSAVDPAGKTGLAEMISGLLDEGAGDLDSEAFQRRLVEIGAEMGFVASDDRFVVTMRMLSASRDPGADLLRTVLTSPRFDAEPVERIRTRMGAIIAEKANDPAGVLELTWQATAFPGHPYGRDSLGTPQTIAAISQADLRQFVSQRFARDNMSIGVVGDITPAELGPLLDRTFGSLPAAAAPAQIPDVTVSGGGQVIVLDYPIPQAIIGFGQDGPSLHDPDFFPMLVVNYTLGGGAFTSRLMEEVRHKRGLAYAVNTGLMMQPHANLIMGFVGTPNAAAGQVLDVIRQEWKRMAEEGPSEQELADAKLFLIGSYALGFTSTMSTAGALVGAQLDGLDMDIFAKRNELVEAVTLEDARRAARRFLDADRLLIVATGRPEGVVATPPADAGSSDGTE